jgi:hypothetical protein
MARLLRPYRTFPYCAVPCRRCHETSGCAFFVADPNSDTCYLKSSAQQGAKPKEHLVAGTMLVVA